MHPDDFRTQSEIDSMRHGESWAGIYDPLLDKKDREIKRLRARVRKLEAELASKTKKKTAKKKMAKAC